MTSNNVMTDRPKFTLPRRFPILESIHSTLATPYAASTVMGIWNQLLALKQNPTKVESEPVTLGKRKRPGNASEYIPVPLPFDEEEEGGVETVEDGEEDQEDVESDDELRNDTHTENVPPGQAFSESAIWEWQAAQEHLAFTAGCKALTQTDDLDMSTWTPETYAAGMEAVATFWEPNRMRYGMVGWYGWDQGGGKQERPKKFVRIEPYGMENVRKVEVDGADYLIGEDIVNAAGEEGEMEKDVEDVQEFTLDELLEDVAAIPDEEMDEMAAVPGDDDEEDDDDDNVQIGVMMEFGDGMEVERDVVYDESELTPEEIEIQRWSVNWRKQRAEEKRIKEEEERNLELERDAARRIEEAQAAFRNTPEFKAKTYPSLYGSATETIIKLEAELERRFVLSGGAGSVTSSRPLDENGRPMEEAPVVVKAVKVVVEKEGGEDGELEDEEGEVGEVRERRRVLWPVLPIRW